MLLAASAVLTLIATVFTVVISWMLLRVAASTDASTQLVRDAVDTLAAVAREQALSEQCRYLGRLKDILAIVGQQAGLLIVNEDYTDNAGQWNELQERFCAIVDDAEWMLSWRLVQTALEPVVSRTRTAVVHLNAALQASPPETHAAQELAVQVRDELGQAYRAIRHVLRSFQQERQRLLEQIQTMQTAGTDPRSP